MANVAPEPTWLTVPEAARYARMRRERLEQVIASGSLPAYRPSTARLVNRADIDAFIMSAPVNEKEVAACSSC